MRTNRTTQLSDYWHAVRRRWVVVIALALVASAAAFVLSIGEPTEYDATAQLLFRQEEPINSLIDNRSFSPVDPEREVNTEVELIKLDETARAVARRLSLNVRPAELLEQVSTEVSSTSDIVSLTAASRDPRRAAAIANAFATEYVAYRLRTARRKYEEAARLAQSQLDALGDEGRASAQGEQLAARKRELEILAALQTGGVEVVRRARVPESPARPKPVLNAVLGGFLGLMVGVAAALALEFRDRRLKDEQDVEEVFELPVLASIPRTNRRGGADDPGSREAYGLLAANLRFSTLTADSSVLMITSSMPGEGKTTVTLNLARALARLGLRVIAIEADLRRPTFARQATLGPSAGLSGLLTGAGQVAQELVWLDAATLAPVTLDDLNEGTSFAVLPAGDLPTNPQRALARPAMASVIETARSLVDVVLIDTAPLGTVNDAAALSPFIDSTALVVRLGLTTKDAARRAMRTVGNLEVRLAGVVVTGGQPAGKGYGYYGPQLPPSAAGRTRASPA